MIKIAGSLTARLVAIKAYLNIAKQRITNLKQFNLT
jgi:hypothetical protein